MSENKPMKKLQIKSVENLSERDKAPEQFETIEDMAEFWETHDTADYEDYFGNEDIDIELTLPHPSKRAKYIALESELAHKVQILSKQRGLSVETLVNLWIQEKLTENA